MELIKHPGDAWVMPHELTRKGQNEAFIELIKFMNSADKSIFCLDAPTGTGKTGIVARLSEYFRVMALVRTKNLQDTVYEGGYGFPSLKGKGSYPCNHARELEEYSAENCAINYTAISRETGMSELQIFGEYCGPKKCPYHIQKELVMESNRMVTNYSKFLLDPKIHNKPQVLVFDEAHELVDLVIDMAGATFNFIESKFITMDPLRVNEDIPIDQGLSILRGLYADVASNRPVQPTKFKSEGHRRFFVREVQRYERLLAKILGLGLMVKEDYNVNVSKDQSSTNERSLWYFHSTSDGCFHVRPLTAKYHFNKLFIRSNTRKYITMSATIKPEIFTYLGAPLGDVEYHRVEPLYSPQLRPIVDLKCPRMGYSNFKKNPNIQFLQAVKISEAIKNKWEVDGEKSSGVILVSSKAKARNLGKFLSNMGFNIFIPPDNAGTDIQLKAWEDARRPGTICISWNFWEGVSLDDDKILIIGSIPFPDLSSPFERARFELDPGEFLWRGAVKFTQGLGRIWRGNPTDYIPWGNKFVSIADANYTRVLKKCPGDVGECIITYDDWKERMVIR